MAFKKYIVLTLMVISSAAFAWQPLTYPIKSQSPYQQGADRALCYAEANRVTKVNTVRESQIPPPAAPARKASSTGVPSSPPLPSHTISAVPMSASMPAAAAEPGARAPAATAAMATGASAAKPASAPTAGTPATAAMAASGTIADLGASGAAMASSSQANAASGVKLPPLPAPEPPMTRYWAAYGACMQARGYVVTQ
ncbi:hypothetical protein [Paraburkholderia phytofirmans]|uniref:hypothetical protein n=1 Tax=Paraburkholderia TaxID=1822464 RepID=UPI0009ED4599|nr:hypothetical protein [Paraburkholderia phytofirmans]